ncbi:MAG: N-acetylmuramoyl-L-alanine amidase [Thermoleophilaceae bacterium]|nr:N-acetylmuramoyl-L-alanine amidase [Thermoleophilaceae bacterium]
MPSLIAVLALLFSLAAAAAPGSAGPLDSLQGKTILVDPGHNGGNAAHPETIDKLVPAGGFRKACDTTGAATNDERLTEPAFNWDVARRLTRLLRASGAEVVLTRKSNNGVGPCINKRASIGNRARADLAISIHADGGEPAGNGFHVIRPGLVRGYTGPIVAPSKALALEIRAALDAAGLARADYIARNGLIARRDLGGLNLSKVPKVLVELGNMRNTADARRLKSAKWREHVARALRSGLAQSLNSE